MVGLRTFRDQIPIQIIIIIIYYSEGGSHFSCFCARTPESPWWYNLWNLLYPFGSHMSDRCITLKPDSALKHLLCRRFPQWGQCFAHEPMLMGRLCQLILLSLWKTQNAIARHSENKRDTSRNWSVIRGSCFCLNYLFPDISSLSVSNTIWE